MDKMKEEKEDAVFMRTMLRKDVHDRLKQYAQSLSSGLGFWDFGVAIERLLDYQNIEARIAVLEEQQKQIDLLLLQQEMKEDDKEKETKYKHTFLGKRGKENGKD